MGKVIKFPERAIQDETSREALKLIRIADQIDAVILEHLTTGDVDPRDIAGILAHRLGTLMRTMDEKDKLFDVCNKVLRKQAAIE